MRPKRQCTTSIISIIPNHLQGFLFCLLSCAHPTMSVRSVSAFHQATSSYRISQRNHRHWLRKPILTRLFSHEPQDHKEQPTNAFFAPHNLFPTFASLGIQSPILLERIHHYFSAKTTHTNSITPRPSAVQAASFKTIQSGMDLTIGAEVSLDLLSFSTFPSFYRFD